MSGIVHFKFKSALSYDSVCFEGVFVTVGELKRLIAEKKSLGKDGSAALVLSDPRTGEEYKDDSHQIPKNTSVLVQRVFAAKLKPIQPVVHSSVHAAKTANNVTASSAAVVATADDDEFGGDLYTEKPAQGGGNDDETKALQALLDANAASWQRDVAMSRGRGRGRGNWGRPAGVPPSHYVCYRCNQQGHWISDCPTNGDPNFDVKPVRLPRGIPMTRLAQNQEGGLLLPDGQVGSLLPNDDAFVSAMAGLPTVADASEDGRDSSGEGGNGTSQPSQQQPHALLTLQGSSGGEAVSGEPSPAHRNFQQQTTASSKPPPPVVPLFVGEDEVFSDLPVMLPSVFPSRSKPPSVIDSPVRGQGDSSPEEAACVPPWLRNPVFPRGLLPEGPVDIVYEAFRGSKPLSREKFEELKLAAAARLRRSPSRRSPSRRSPRRSPARRTPSRKSPSRSRQGRSRSPYFRRDASRRSRSRSRWSRSRSKERRRPSSRRRSVSHRERSSQSPRVRPNPSRQSRQDRGKSYSVKRAESSDSAVTSIKERASVHEITTSFRNGPSVVEQSVSAVQKTGRAEQQNTSHCADVDEVTERVRPPSPAQLRGKPSRHKDDVTFKQSECFRKDDSRCLDSDSRRKEDERPHKRSKMEHDHSRLSEQATFDRSDDAPSPDTPKSINDIEESHSEPSAGGQPASEVEEQHKHHQSSHDRRKRKKDKKSKKKKKHKRHKGKDRKEASDASQQSGQHQDANIEEDDKPNDGDRWDPQAAPPNDQNCPTSPLVENYEIFDAINDDTGKKLGRQTSRGRRDLFDQALKDVQKTVHHEHRSRPGDDGKSVKPVRERRADDDDEDVHISRRKPVRERASSDVAAAAKDVQVSRRSEGRRKAEIEDRMDEEDHHHTLKDRSGKSRRDVEAPEKLQSGRGGGEEYTQSHKDYASKSCREARRKDTERSDDEQHYHSRREWEGKSKRDKDSRAKDDWDHKYRSNRRR